MQYEAIVALGLWHCKSLLGCVLWTPSHLDSPDFLLFGSIMSKSLFLLNVLPCLRFSQTSNLMGVLDSSEVAVSLSVENVICLIIFKVY